MASTALLPLWRKACWGFFCPKIRRLRPGVKPRNWVPKASTLLLDHQSHCHVAGHCNLLHQLVSMHRPCSFHISPLPFYFLVPGNICLKHYSVATIQPDNIVNLGIIILLCKTSQQQSTPHKTQHSDLHNFRFIPSCYIFQSITLTIIRQKRNRSTKGKML